MGVVEWIAIQYNSGSGVVGVMLVRVCIGKEVVVLVKAMVKMMMSVSVGSIFPLFTSWEAV